jgi:hypothetical protein
VILAFSFRVVGRSMSDDIGWSVLGCGQPSVRLRPCRGRTGRQSVAEGTRSRPLRIETAED